MPLDLLGKIMALMCAVVWAGAVILFKLAGDRIRPLALNLYKTALTVTILFPLLLLLKIPLIPAGMPGKYWLAVMASGILGIAVSDTLFFACLNRLGAGMTAIVDALYAPFVMTATWLFLLQKPRLEQVGGALLVIAAVLTVAYRKSGSPLPTRRVISGIIFGVAAMAIMAVSIVLMQPVLNGASVFWVTELRMLAALAVLLVMFAWQKERRQMLAPLWQKGSRHYAFWGALLGNLISMTLWVGAFKFTSVNSAAVLNQTNTVFVVVMASVFLKETFTRRRLLATALAVAGSLLVLLG
ncbi:MAG: DMT family transporter [Acidobacteriota bacterium]|jgi:drug/metabolite transporter (DMT)-like permease|nr:DMT family transporter [Acidobacteriota bacterium]